MSALPQIITYKSWNQAVSAYELYYDLELDPSQWSRWSKKNIENNPFAIEGADWVRHDVEKPINKGDYTGRPLKDFALTVDFAKRLAMMARSEAGERVRNHFIECEKIASGQILKKLPTAKELAQMVIEAEEEKERAVVQLNAANEIIEKQAPKVKYVNEVLSSNTPHTTTSIAKELGMSAIELNKRLKERGVQYQHDNHWVLYSKYQDKGFTKTRTHTWYDTENRLQSNIQTVWTEKGRAFIHSLFNPNLKGDSPDAPGPAPTQPLL